MKTISSARRSERGEGNFGNMAKLAVFAILGLAAYNAGPIYFANYQFKDRLTEIAGAFPPNKDGDTRATAAVEQAITDAGLREYLPEGTCTVTSAGGLGGLRTVSCIYDRTFKLLPGMSPKTVHFDNTVSRPMF